MTAGESSGLLGSERSESRRIAAAIKSAFEAVLHWKASVSFALLDQGTSGLTNFALTIIAARSLPIDEFGQYVNVWALSWLILPAATALINDPLPAIVSARHPRIRRTLLGAAVRLNLLLGCVLAGMILLSGAIVWIWSPKFGMLLLCLAIATPMQLMQIAGRRFCYLVRRQGIAAASAIVCSSTLLAGAIGLWASGLCTGHGLILLSGVASMAASTVAIATGCVPFSKVRPALRNWLIAQCWRTGKWLAGSSIALAMSGMAILPAAAAISGPSASGILRAEQTLLLPIYQFSTAMGFLLIPHLAEVNARQPARNLRAATLLTIAVFGAIATGFSISVLALGSDLLTLIYDKPEITRQSRLLWPLAISTILEAVTYAMAIVLMAKGITRILFLSRIASVAAFLAGALWLGPIIGLDAAVWALVAASAVAALINIPALVRAVYERDTDAAPDMGVPDGGAMTAGTGKLDSMRTVSYASGTSAKQRRRILVSAYAFSPVLGSEPGVGWNICSRLAAYHDVTVLTRSWNERLWSEDEQHKEEAEQFMRNMGPIPGLTIKFVDSPPLSRLFQMRPLVSLRSPFHFVGYAAWQRAAYREAVRLHREQPFDATHQLTITSFREPGYLWKLNVPFIWGPIGGGGNIPWSYFAAFGAHDRLYYGIKNIANELHVRTKWRSRRAARRAERIFVNGAEAYRIASRWGASAQLLLDTGAPKWIGRPRQYDGTRRLRLCWGALHIGRKALPLLLYALAELKRGTLGEKVHLTILGSGPESQTWRTLCCHLQIDEMVTWLGQVPYQRLLATLDKEDVFISSGVQEGTPMIVMQALAVGLPIICHDIAGMSTAVNESCGIKFPLRDAESSIRGFAEAIAQLVTTRDLANKLSKGALRRAEALSWEGKVNEIVSAYDVILGNRNGGTPCFCRCWQTRFEQ